MDLRVILVYVGEVIDLVSVLVATLLDAQHLEDNFGSGWPGVKIM